MPNISRCTVVEYIFRVFRNVCMPENRRVSLSIVQFSRELGFKESILASFKTLSSVLINSMLCSTMPYATRSSIVSPQSEPIGPQNCILGTYWLRFEGKTELEEKRADFEHVRKADKKLFCRLSLNCWLLSATIEIISSQTQ
jgi:hypothetical protein